MRVLALDIGTTTGWAVAHDGAPPLPAPAPLLGDPEEGAKAALRHYHHGLWNGSEIRDRGRFYGRLTTWLASHVERFHPGLIAYEFNPHGASQMKDENAALKTFGIAAMVDLIAYENGVPTTIVNTSSMQLLAVGTGRDRGKKLRKARLRDLGIKDDNEGDAIFTLSWVLQDRQHRRRVAA